LMDEEIKMAAIKAPAEMPMLPAEVVTPCME